MFFSIQNREIFFFFFFLVKWGCLFSSYIMLKASDDSLSCTFFSDAYGYLLVTVFCSIIWSSFDDLLLLCSIHTNSFKWNTFCCLPAFQIHPRVLLTSKTSTYRVQNCGIVDRNLLFLTCNLSRQYCKSISESVQYG